MHKDSNLLGVVWFEPCVKQHRSPCNLVTVQISLVAYSLKCTISTLVGEI